MYDAVIKLVSQVDATDEYGDTTATTTEKVVFAELKSIGQTEFYQASAVGLKPEVKFVLADYYEYANEKMIKYAPAHNTEEVYTVIRTYRKDNTLELVCKRGIDG